MEPQSQAHHHHHLLHRPICFVLLILIHGSTASASAGGKGVSIQLIHRDSVDSPLYLGNLTAYELLERRVNYGRAHVQAMQNRARRGDGAVRPDSLTPIVEHERDRLEYLARVYIGSEKIPQYVQIDTGSNLVWVQCEPYQGSHFIQDPPHYVIGESTTMTYVPCEDKAMCLPEYTCNWEQRCIAQEFYVDGAWAKGYMAKDDFYFEDDEGGMEVVPRINFGCMYSAPENIFNSGKIAGMMGMGQGHQSMAWQIYYDRGLGGQFSYCFVPLLDTRKSYLKLGGPFGFKTPPVTLNAVWNSHHPSHYYLNLTGISCHTTRLSVRKKDLAIDEKGDGGCILDSGTSVMHLIRPAFVVLEKFVTRYFKGSGNIERGPGPMDICYWVWPGPVKPPPSITLHFGGGKSYFVPPEIAWETIERDGTKMICLGILANDKFTILGASYQINHRFVFEFDFDHTRISFAQENCAEEIPS